jgi:hypothetical protein
MAVDLAALDAHSARTITDELSDLARDYPSESQALRQVSANDRALHFARDPDILAYSITTGEHRGIYFNAQAITERAERPTIGLQEELSGWTVPGGGSLKGIVSHEFGEQLADRIIADAALRAELNRAVSRILGAPYDAAGPHGPELLALVSTHLSTYGATTPHDLVAEAFTEYRTALRPRPLAMEIGGFIDRHFAGDRPAAEAPRQADVLEPVHARRREPAGDQPGENSTARYGKPPARRTPRRWSSCSNTSSSGRSPASSRRTRETGCSRAARRCSPGSRTPGPARTSTSFACPADSTWR